MAEWTISTTRQYADPFNDVDVDVIFNKGKESWRVPTFWRGGNRWTVRFSPPAPGNYRYRLESTDKSNPDLNGHQGRVTIAAYAGDNSLLKHGGPRVSANHRYFEHADGTPFYWLGDTVWTGLSDRLPWEGFQQLVADRKDKGFTVMQICAGLIPDEENAPSDRGFHNEGGFVWDPEFRRINPNYFDYADRRIEALVNAGITPALVGGWQQILKQMGRVQLQKHWRYIIARYGAYPVFWVLGGEIDDPPQAIADQIPQISRKILSPGWSEIARYVRATDPYHHPLTAHESFPPFDIPLQSDTLTDFDLIQPSHFGWVSIGTEVMQLNRRYSRTDVVKPVVQGEIGYELIGGTNLEDFQRTAFWLAMLNGAAGHTYGAAPTYEANNPDKPLHREGQYTFLTWQEGLRLPGSYQIGLGAKLLRQYSWWQFQPHPEWVIPHGTNLLEPHRGPRVFRADDFNRNAALKEDSTPRDEFLRAPETIAPGGEWQTRGGTFHAPYASGIPEKIRVIYLPYFGLMMPSPPTVLGLERGVRYHAYYWDPMLGIQFDLGAVQVPTPGDIELKEDFTASDSEKWLEAGSAKAQWKGGKLVSSGHTLSIVRGIQASDIVLAVDAQTSASVSLILRYQDSDNYVAVLFSAPEGKLYFLTRTKGIENGPIGAITVAPMSPEIHLSAEVRANFGVAMITEGKTTYSTPIVDIAGGSAVAVAEADRLREGAVGLMHPDDGTTQSFTHFEVRRSPIIAPDENLERKLYDARGIYRGELSGPGWDDFGRKKAILLNAYRPERFPSSQDWVLVLAADPKRSRPLGP